MSDNTSSLHHKNDAPFGLWLSMMCAAGYENGKLAKVIIENDGDANSEACDKIN